MFRIVFLLFIIVPIIEIYLLIAVGSRIGALNTILIIIITAIIGTSLLRLQGLSTLARVQENIDRGKLPATEIIEGLMLLVSGALLLTPGFFTDAVGFLCLIPGIRIHVANYLLRHFLASRRGQTTAEQQDNVTIEGEYWEESDKPSSEQDRLPK